MIELLCTPLPFVQSFVLSSCVACLFDQEASMWWSENRSSAVLCTCHDFILEPVFIVNLTVIDYITCGLILFLDTYSLD
jgi:hypothetical protein